MDIPSKYNIVATNLPGKTGSEVANIREKQMSQIENRQENKTLRNLTGLGIRLDIKV